jgi:hypothetical protein
MATGKTHTAMNTAGQPSWNVVRLGGPLVDIALGGMASLQNHQSIYALTIAKQMIVAPVTGCPDRLAASFEWITALDRSLHIRTIGAIVCTYMRW